MYNWQYVHCIDFWCIVLARACDAQAERERGGQESELKALVYPLVQVSLGAIKYVPVMFDCALGTRDTNSRNRLD